jgi:hypothetical protein
MNSGIDLLLISFKPDISLRYAQVAALGHQLDREMAGYVLEDTRLSTLQRKLAKETEPTVALALALFINDCILKVGT